MNLGSQSVFFFFFNYMMNHSKFNTAYHFCMAASPCMLRGSGTMWSQLTYMLCILVVVDSKGVKWKGTWLRET